MEGTTMAKPGKRTRDIQFRGVFKCNKKFKSQIQTNKTQRYLGLYETQEDAAKSYDLFAIGINGNHAVTNFSYSQDYIAGVRKTLTSRLPSDSSNLEVAHTTVNPPVEVKIDLNFEKIRHALISLQYEGTLTNNIGDMTDPSNIANTLIELAANELKQFDFIKATNRSFENEVDWRDQLYHYVGKVSYIPKKRQYLLKGYWKTSFNLLTQEEIYDFSEKPDTQNSFEFFSEEKRDTTTNNIPMAQVVSGHFEGHFNYFNGSVIDTFRDEFKITFHSLSNILSGNSFNKNVPFDDIFNPVYGDGHCRHGGYFIITGYYNSLTNFIYLRRQYVTNIANARSKMTCNDVEKISRKIHINNMASDIYGKSYPSYCITTETENNIDNQNNTANSVSIKKEKKERNNVFPLSSIDDTHVRVDNNKIRSTTNAVQISNASEFIENGVSNSTEKWINMNFNQATANDSQFGDQQLIQTVILNPGESRTQWDI